MTLREFITACEGVSNAVLDTEVKICFDAGSVFYSSSIDKIVIATESNFIGPSGILCESELASEIESIEDYNLYIPKNTLILYAHSEFIQQ